MKRENWDRRVRRAEDLARGGSPASEVLAFYAHILALQREIYQSASEGYADAGSGSVVRQQLNLEAAQRWLPRLLDVVEMHAPEPLVHEAQRMRSANRGQDVMREFLESEASREPSEFFFARILFQPMAESQLGGAKTLQGSFDAVCPASGSKPQFAVLYPEGDGGKRYLACSLCFTEWEFRRVLCPACGETDHTMLPRFSPDEGAVRVEACETCKHYLKSFDMTLNGLMVPDADEIATVALDVWAVEEGYRKIQLNVMGF